MALSGWLGRIIRHVLKDRGHMVHCFMWHKFWLMLVSKQAFPYHESFVEVLTNRKPTHGILLNFWNNSSWTYLSHMVHHWAHGQPPNRQTNFPMELVYSWIFFFSFLPLNSIYFQRTIFENIFHYTCNKKTNIAKRLTFKEWNLNNSYKMLIALIIFATLVFDISHQCDFVCTIKKMEPQSTPIKWMTSFQIIFRRWPKVRDDVCPFVMNSEVLNHQVPTTIFVYVLFTYISNFRFWH